MSKNRFGAVVIFGFSIAYGMIALHFPVPPAFNDSASPSSFPISLSAAGIIVSMLIFLLPATSAATTPELTSKGILRVFLLLLLMIFYGFVIKIFGFFVSTILFLSIGFSIMGERKLKVIFLTATVTTIIFWVSLTQFLKIYLDSGSLSKFVFGLLNLD
ncbi:hypothetical protein CMK22_02345 [Candidatus Poribacteria bacterium]|nr:hypothetical protein [Candidatus Poribacteria bacterium]